MKYRYTGQTRTREEVEGILEAEDEVEAKMRLRGMQIRATSLVPEKVAGKAFDLKALNITIGSPIGLKALMIFTRQFSSLIDSGVPVVQCLDILVKQEKNKLFRDVLASIKADIESGGGFAQSLGKHPKIFSDFFVQIIAAGEISGTMDQAFKRVGVQLEKLGKLRAKVIGALTYPLITFFVAVVVLIFLLVKVVPEIAKLYSDAKSKLPEVTQAVLNLSAWFQTYYLHLVGGIAAAVGCIYFLTQYEPFRKVWDPISLKIPLFGPLILKSSVAKLTRTLSTLLSSGVPLLAAFEICKRLMSNHAVRDSVEMAAQAVSSGRTIASGLDESHIFPPMVVHMVGIGEMTGRLDELLGKVADIFDDEVDDAVNQVTNFIQPAMIIVVGILVAFLLIAMYLPIMQLADKMGGT